MGVNDPGGGIPLNNYFSALSDPNEPKRKKNKNVVSKGVTSIMVEEKFLLMESVSEGRDLSRVNPFLLNKVLENAMGVKPEHVTRLRDGKLLLRVKSEKIALKAKAIKKIPEPCGIAVRVIDHPTLNTCKGIIRCPDIEFMSEEEILAGLKDQKVSEVVIMKRKWNEEVVNTRTAIITFQTTIVPRSVDFGLYPVLVDVYIPKPMRCTTCLKIGHTKKWCKGERVCANCSMPEHEGQCPYVKCVLCTGNHHSLDKECPIYLDEWEIQKIKTLDRITYAEAKKKRRLQCPTAPKNYTTTEKTFAQTTKATRNEPNTEKTTKSYNSEMVNLAEQVTQSKEKDTQKEENETQQTTRSCEGEGSSSSYEKSNTKEMEVSEDTPDKFDKLIVQNKDGVKMALRSLSAAERVNFFK